MKSITDMLSVAWKDLQIILRDRGLLIVIILMPLLLGTMLGQFYRSMYSTSEEQATITLKVYLVNLDSGNYGSKVVQAMKSIGTLDIEELQGENGRAQADQAVAEGKKMAAVIIPADFSQKIEAYEPSQVQVIVDPTQPQFSNIVTGLMNYAISPADIEGNLRYGIRSLLGKTEYFQQATADQQAGLEAQSLGAIMTQLQAMFSNPLITIAAKNMEVETQQPSVDPFTLFVPGFTVMFAFFLIGPIGSYIFNEKDNGTMRRQLASPVRRGALVAGKMLAFGIMVFLQVIVLFGIAAFAFGMKLGNSPSGLFVVTLALALAVTSFGFMIAALVRTGKQADSFGTLLGFLLAGLGGCIFMSIPPMFRWNNFLGYLSRLTPHSHALNGYYMLIVEGKGLMAVLPEVAILLGFAVLFFGIASWRLKLE